MRVRVSLTVEVDADAWAAEYGIALADVRDDVQRSAAYAVRTMVAAVAA